LRQALHLLGETFDLRGEMAWNVFMHNRVTEEGAVVTDLSTGPGGFAVAHVCVPGLWDRFVDPARGRDVRRG
ncbi:MAG TPA: hypothetical protein RMH26_28695, partial [Polyangiaceae bacterium LLY-WYZ-15_(1-7)]|nr:hypothetical protein [Polyangiaceae bacterium LLY-WYZ-15_(1-7)]